VLADYGAQRIFLQHLNIVHVQDNRSNSSPSSTDLCLELGTNLQDVVAVGNKYPWANPSSAGAAGRRDKLLHSLCSAKIQAAKSWVLPNRVQALSFFSPFSPKRKVSSNTRQC
jgi:hypothetical protein